MIPVFRLFVLLLLPLVASAQAPATAFPFKKGDRVAWIGSSSTNIGIWPRTMEFLLHTRHPELRLTFQRFTTGGGTFATGLQNLDKWLAEYKPTLVFFNYGGNDAGAGEKGLPQFKKNIEQSVAKVQAAGARVVLMTHQAADVRKAGDEPAARRKLYAETMLAFGKEKSWPVIDIFHPIQELQQKGQKDDDAYTILKDKIHLTEPAYVAWGYFLFERLNPQPPESSVRISARGEVTETVKCKVEEILTTKSGIAFTRLDEILPLLPPAALPPAKHVPLEKLSVYRLQVSGLADGKYDILCEGQRLGAADAKTLTKGVNLNTLVLQSKEAAPWDALAKQIWAGKGLDQIGRTRWRFEVRLSKP